MIANAGGTKKPKPVCAYGGMLENMKKQKGKGRKTHGL